MFEEGQTVRVVSTENGLYVGNEYEVEHAGEDANGEPLYVLKVDMTEPYKSLDVAEGGSGKANAGFYEHQLEAV